ncbi:hypothetical protein [Candidatus Enterococcus mansonii]|uniref:Lipoprotein n=1 Tax=Candidatus Enterococcus mansonii TaxID=1834181 RepID=A0A242CIA0_9ENTE|nr:hypothetical protein [Enterococcus sp. 4G2_DIV0659]OTO09955.1 hypothetical protein A5880_000638 [Enterococcus sp. 4G2_DIV0659]
MKVTKIVIGILSIILSLFILFQSCVAGISDNNQNNSEGFGSTGILLAICILTAGIIAIATRDSSDNGGFVAAGFYVAGGIIGFLLAGINENIYVWSMLSIIFGTICAIGDTKKDNITDLF